MVLSELKIHLSLTIQIKQHQDSNKEYFMEAGVQYPEKLMKFIMIHPFWLREQKMKKLKRSSDCDYCLSFCLYF